MSIKIKILYALLVGLVIYTLWPGNESNDVSSIRVWNAQVNEQGQITILGVTLGKTTLKEAEVALHSQSERGLFVNMVDGKMVSEHLEAYFPTSPDRAKIIVELIADAELIERIKKSAYRVKAFPSGSMKLEISPDETAHLGTLVAKSLTYIPPVSLTVETLEQQFGPSDKQQRDVDGNLHLLYSKLGLDAVLPVSGKPMLQFVPPDEFERLLKLIKLPPQAADVETPL